MTDTNEAVEDTRKHVEATEQSSEQVVSNYKRLSRHDRKLFVDWRRSQALLLLSQGKSQAQIGQKLNVHQSVISRDIAFIRKEASENLSKHIEEILPFEHAKRIASIDQVLKELWELLERTSEARERRQILEAISQTVLVRASLDGDSASVERALKAVTAIKKKITSKITEYTTAESST